MADASVTIRQAHEGDVSLILRFIEALADYEKMSRDVVATEENIRDALFGDKPLAHVIIGEIKGEPCGFALYFYNFSTFLGRAGLYLEDLYVEPNRRGSGLGRAMLLHLAKKAYAEGCGRMDWAVLDWNKPSIDFYEALGAKAQNEWTGYRLDREGLKQLSQ